MQDNKIKLDESHTIINTSQRGLSNSRNMAISNAVANICLLSDDDEIFADDLESIITKEYDSNKDADIIAFVIGNFKNKLGNRRKKLKKPELLRVSSCQISFRRESIQNKVFFDPLLGSGSGNGASEEIKFLLDCYRSGLSIYYCPTEIGTLIQDGSQWFLGHDEKFFYQRGAVSRYIYGLPFALLYELYYDLAKQKEYRDEITFGKAIKNTFHGIIDNPIKRQTDDKREQRNT